MSWPLASHFSAMLQNPRHAFRDPELKTCRVEKDERNQPRPWAGAFAVVYKGTSQDGRQSFAIRIFTTESPERRERYDRISEYLKTRRVGCLVDFEYRDRSIRSAGDGKWYPLIVMDWVQGETLLTWVRARSLARDTEALTAAADRWVELLKEMAEAKISHGDLQHANVMVTPAGELKLVDYDCVCVPALVGRRNLEVGVEPYQHPDRNERTLLSLELDHFSSLVIYVGLRALAVDPLLWMKYVEGPGHDKLLFRREDFQAPAASPLYHDLLHSSDPQVRELSEKLFALRRVPMDQVPPLGRLASSYAKIEQLLRAQQWEEAVALLNTRRQFLDAPPYLVPLINRAYEHVERQRAWAKLCSLRPEDTEQSDRALTAAWNESLFAGFPPAEGLRPRLGLARWRVAMLEPLRRLAAECPEPASYAHEVKIILAARQLPQGYRYDLLGRVEKARRSVRAILGLEETMKRPAPDAAVLSAWRRVVKANCAGMVRAEFRPRIELAQQRAPLLRALRGLTPDMPRDQLDRRLLEVWREDLLAGCPEAEPWRAAHEEAVGRRAVLGRLQVAVETRNDQDISRLMDEPCLAGYPLPAAWKPLIDAAQERIARTEVLVLAMANGERSAFRQLFDARVIRRYAERFAPHQELLCEWIRSEILPADNMGLCPALGRGSLVCVDQAQGTYRLRWTWPQQRFADECILAVCAEEPSVEHDPRTVAAFYRQTIDRQNWESGGGSRLIHVERQWMPGVVVVWAMVDVGFRVFASHPLVLGRVGEGVKRRVDNGRGWPGLFRRRAQPPKTPSEPAAAKPAAEPEAPPAVPAAEPKDEGPGA